LKISSKKPVIVGYFIKTESEMLKYKGGLKNMEKDQVLEVAQQKYSLSLLTKSFSILSIK